MANKNTYTILVIDDQYNTRKPTYEGLFRTKYDECEDYSFDMIPIQKVAEFNRFLSDHKHIDAIFLDAVLDGSWKNNYSSSGVLQRIEKMFPKRRTPPLFMVSKNWVEDFTLLGEISTNISSLERFDHPSAFFDYSHLHDIVEKANEYFKEEDADLKQTHIIDLVNLRQLIIKEILKKNAKECVDALILTAVTDEKTKIYEMFGLSDDNDQQLADDGLPYQIAFVDGLRIAFVTQAKMGLTEAARATESIINAFDPKLLILCGICAGDINTIHLGSIVIPQVIYDYSTGKVTKKIIEAPLEEITNMDAKDSTEFLLRDEPVKANSSMTAFFQFVENPTNISYIIEEIEKNYNSDIIPENDRKKSIVTYPMASGPFIVNSKEVFSLIQNTIPNYKNCAIDMEAYAFARVAEIHNKPWIVVKTVQDYANGNKTNDEKLARGYASYSSAKLIRMCISRMMNCIKDKS